MGTRNRWGMVYVAIVFALLVIGTAYATFRYEEGQKAVLQTALASASSSQPAAAVANAPEKTPLTQSLSQDLYAGYLGLTQQGTFTAAQRDQMLADIVKKDVRPQNVVPLLTTTDLNVVATTSVDTYAAFAAVILSQMSQIPQDESYVFADTVQKEVTTGTPTLISDANLYGRIAAALLSLQVPPALAVQHLEVVKSVAALSNTVKNMGTWKGDPIEAMQDVDTLNKVRTYLKNSIDTLTAAVEALRKQAS